MKIIVLVEYANETNTYDLIICKEYEDGIREYVHREENIDAIKFGLGD